MPTISKAASIRRQRRNLQRISRSANTANAMLKQFTDHPSETYQLLLKIAGQIAFETTLGSACTRKKQILLNETIIEFTKLLMEMRKTANLPKSNDLHRPKIIKGKRVKTRPKPNEPSETLLRAPSPRGRRKGLVAP